MYERCLPASTLFRADPSWYDGPEMEDCPEEIIGGL